MEKQIDKEIIYKLLSLIIRKTKENEYKHENVLQSDLFQSFKQIQKIWDPKVVFSFHTGFSSRHQYSYNNNEDNQEAMFFPDLQIDHNTYRPDISIWLAMLLVQT